MPASTEVNANLHLNRSNCGPRQAALNPHTSSLKSILPTNHHSLESLASRRTTTLTVAIFIERFENARHECRRDSCGEHRAEHLRVDLLLPSILTIPCAQVEITLLEIFDFLF